ncbi:MAG: hypothetical protein ABI720_08310 [Actinomycetes bacterium]
MSWSDFEAMRSGEPPERPVSGSSTGVALRLCGAAAAVAGLLIGYFFREFFNLEMFDLGWQTFTLFVYQYLLAALFALVGGALLLVAGRRTWGYAPAVPLLAWALLELGEYARYSIWGLVQGGNDVDAEAFALAGAWLLLLIAVFGVLVCAVVSRSFARPPAAALVVWLGSLAALLYYRWEEVSPYLERGPGSDLSGVATSWVVAGLGAVAVICALVFAGLHPERAVRVWAPAVFGVVAAVYWLVAEAWRYIDQMRDNLSFALYTAAMVLALVAAVLYAVLGRRRQREPAS